MHFWKRYESLSLRQNSPRVCDVARRYQLAVPDRGFEPSKMKTGGFDNFAEQSWTHEVRSRASARDERRSPVANNPSLPHDTARAQRSVSRLGDACAVRTLEHQTRWVRQLNRTEADTCSGLNLTSTPGHAAAHKALENVAYITNAKKAALPLRAGRFRAAHQ